MKSKKEVVLRLFLMEDKKIAACRKIDLEDVEADELISMINSWCNDHSNRSVEILKEIF